MNNQQSPNNNNQGGRMPGRNGRNNKNFKIPGFGLYLIIFMVLMGTIGVMLDFPTGEEPLAYSDVVALFKGQQVEAFVIEENYLTMQLKDESIVEYELPSVE
ncbi:MAG: hypothetical protein IIW34_06015, partial [Clostridia bacterium]|nr:hypothetical protein [Clostridia bacterium]